LHTREAGPQVFLLARERRFQDALENLFMTKLQSLLDGSVRIKGSQASMFISAAGEVPQGSQIGQPRK